MAEWLGEGLQNLLRWFDPTRNVKDTRVEPAICARLLELQLRIAALHHLSLKQMSKQHFYKPVIRWTGNLGNGTASYHSYKRDHTITAANKPPIPASSDPASKGDATRYNPEELLVASLSSCHMLWFLHLCADKGILVTDYVDDPIGEMEETANGGGRFKEVILHPIVTITDASRTDELQALHDKAHELCFIANSVNFTVRHEAVGKVGGPQ